MEHVGNLDECQALVAQLAGDVKRSVAVDPEIGRMSADLFAYLREIFWCDAEFGSIICHLAVFAVNAAIKQSKKLVHHCGILRRDGILSIIIGMEVEEIQNHKLDGTPYTLLVIQIRWCRSGISLLENPEGIERIGLH